MSNPTCDFALTQQLVYEILDVATVTAGTFNDGPGNPRWLEANIKQWIVNADFEVAKTICETAGHPRRNYYATSATVVNQGPLPSNMIGPISSVIITYNDSTQRTAIPAPTDWIDLFNTANNAVFGGALYTDGYYQQIGNRLQFSGTTATVNYCTVSIGTAAVNGLVSPPEFINAVVRGAVVQALMKEAEYMEPAQVFDRDHQNDLQVIRSKGIVIAPIESAQLAGA